MITGNRKSYWFSALAVWAFVFGMIPAARATADSVFPGYDLFVTVPGTEFMGVPLMGVPLGTYNFGSGPVDTGPTDTIIQRLSTVPSPSGTTPLKMDALQLETVTPTNLGAGLGNYFITLDPSQASTGAMTIDFTGSSGGTFSSSLDVYFDIRFSSLNGPVVYKALTPLTLSSDAAPWGLAIPPGAILINGVNHDLNGTNTANDFWPGMFSESEPGATHTVDPAVATAGVPPPASLPAGAMLAVAVAWLSRRRQPA